MLNEAFFTTASFGGGETNEITAAPTAGDILEFAKLFEEDGNNFLQQHQQQLQQHQQQADEDALAPRPIAPQALPNPAPMKLDNTSAASTGQEQPLVNVLFLVDPTTQQVILSSQQPYAATAAIQPDNKSIHTSLINEFVANNSNSLNALQQQQQQLSAQQQQLGAGPKISFAGNNATASPLPFTLASLPGFGALQQQQQQQQPVAAQQVVLPPALPPLRALSAYNFFFRDERDRILHEKEHDWSVTKQDQLLREHWSRDRTKKRRHRKTHGKIDFTTLSKLISSRWKELPANRKEFYREIASRDWERYQAELADYKIASGEANNSNSNNQQQGVFSPVVG